ncbi:hypothetical protein BKA57DRAFT_441033 [Linnemannia elongata]|nr:hypothetical protein BKA57DRAFT_441033 [Linnemannia elongata]
MESLSAAFPGTPSTVSFSFTEHHRWIFMFAAKSPFNIAGRVAKTRFMLSPFVWGVASSAIGSEKENISRQLNSSSPTEPLSKSGTVMARALMGKCRDPQLVTAFTIPSATSGENDLRVELTIEKPPALSPHTAAHGQGQGAKEEWDSPDYSSSSESPKSTDSDDSNGTMSP